MTRRQAKKMLRCGWSCTHNFHQLDKAEAVIRRAKASLYRAGSEVPRPLLSGRWGRWDWRRLERIANDLEMEARATPFDELPWPELTSSDVLMKA